MCFIKENSVRLILLQVWVFHMTDNNLIYANGSRKSVASHAYKSCPTALVPAFSWFTDSFPLCFRKLKCFSQYLSKMSFLEDVGLAVSLWTSYEAISYSVSLLLINSD